MNDGQPGKLILIRHAQSEWNAVGRWQGHEDPPLSSLGLEQALSLAESLSGERFDRIYSSDLQRALQTARAVGARHALEVQIDAAFRELDVGRWSGLTREQIEVKDAELLAAFDTGNPRVRPGAGETRAELRQRARDRVTLIAAEHPGERIAIVCHLGFIRALLPEAEPENASAITVSIAKALSARLPKEEAGPSQPL